MKEISCFIKSKIQNNTEYIIPKLIIQTYHTNLLHDKIYENIEKILDINPEYDYRLITDSIGVELIKQHFGHTVFSAYNKLNVGAAKGDFLRYIAIYIYGGVYIDLDSTIVQNLDEVIDNNLDYYLFWDYGNNIMNTPIISKPRNPIILNIIQEVVKRINNYELNIFLATGPSVVNDVIYKDITNEYIYNVKKNVSSKIRQSLWINNANYKNGKIINELSAIKFRIDGYSNELLYPNNDKYIVTFDTPTPYLYKYIYIGNSDENIKMIKLDKIYTPDTQLLFICNYNDRFAYKFNNDELLIKRTDKNTGWGQELIAYL